MSRRTYLLLRRAILHLRPVAATYQGRRRYLCPHVIGHTGGRPHVLCYQFAGESESGLAPDDPAANWRCMYVDELTDVSVREGQWHTAWNYWQQTSCVEEIDVRAPWRLPAAVEKARRGPAGRRRAGSGRSG